MKWLTAEPEHHDIQAEWKRLRGYRVWNAGFTRALAWLETRVNWKDTPSNQWATPEEMAAAGWEIDQSRDDDGRLAE